MTRKTIKVEEVRRTVNELNRLSTGPKCEREGANALLEWILQTTDNYKGYTYLNGEDVPEGQLPGIIYGKLGGDNIFPDETRRYYL